MLYDLNLYAGEDLAASDSGDIATVSGVEMGKQRIIRRLTTCVYDYIFQPEYGAGLPKQVGAVANVAEIQSMVSGQMKLEACVSQAPPPTITVTAMNDGVALSIVYTDSGNQQSVYLDVNVSNPS